MMKTDVSGAIHIRGRLLLGRGWNP